MEQFEHQYERGHIFKSEVPRMTWKHFQYIATIIADIEDPTGIFKEQVMHRFAWMLEDRYEGFDTRRFLDVCRNQVDLTGGGEDQ